MADQQPGDEPAAAGGPDSGQPGGAVEGSGEPSTVDAPARWSGSAAVPAETPKKSRNWRRAARLGPSRPAQPPPPAQPSPAQPSPAQPSPAQPSPAQPSPARPSP